MKIFIQFILFIFFSLFFDVQKSFSDEKIKQNYEAFMQTIIKEKPIGIKGDFILSEFLTSTMGVSYKLKFKD